MLVIDDEELIRSALADMLGDEGHEVRTAADGRRGLQIIEGWMPDIILLDLSMPVMGGRSFREAQLALPHALMDVPIIALTGARNAEEQARAIGAVAVLSKPFDLNELEQAVDKAMDSRSRN